MSINANGKLIAFRSDRLGARVVSLMNAMRLAEDLGTDFSCAWIESTGVGDVFNDPTELFDADFVGDHFLSPEAWREARPKAEVLSGVMQRQPDLVAKTLASGQDMIVGNAFGVIVLEGEDERKTTDRFRAQFQRIPFAKPLVLAMQKLDESLKGHTAYHIRRGDLTDDPKAKHKDWHHKVVQNEFYEFHIEQVLSDKSGGAILFSDDQTSIDHYRAKYPSLKTIDDLIDLEGLTQAQGDFFELYAMSRCATIIAPPRSAFSSTAADLTGARKVSVTDDLSPDLQTKANEALLARLLNDPDSFESDGRMGQALAHVGDWLGGQERWTEAARLFAAHVASGLNISFIYPRAMQFQHRCGDVAGVLETARHMSERPVVYIKDQATAEMLRGYAHLRAGRMDLAFTHMTNGFWHSPNVAPARVMMPLLAEAGLLGERNFLPVSKLQLDLQRRRGPLKTLFTDYPALTTVEGVSIPPALGSLDAITWDWAPLMRSVSFPALVRQGAIEGALEKLSAAGLAEGENADHDSLVAVLKAFGGEAAEASERLQALATRDDATAMTWQRLSHAHWLARRFGKAAPAARRALEHAPDCPAMAGWLGMTALRIKKADEALEHLSRARAGIPGLPSLPYLEAQALARLKRREEALESVRAALALAPLQVDYALLCADLLDRTGDPHAGVKILLRLVEAQRAPGKLFVRLLDLLDRLGERDLHQEMSALARVRIPKHPSIAAIESETA